MSLRRRENQGRARTPGPTGGTRGTSEPGTDRTSQYRIPAPQISMNEAGVRRFCRSASGGSTRPGRSVVPSWMPRPSSSRPLWGVGLGHGTGRSTRPPAQYDPACAPLHVSSRRDGSWFGGQSCRNVFRSTAPLGFPSPVPCAYFVTFAADTAATEPRCASNHLRDYSNN